MHFGNSAQTASRRRGNIAIASVLLAFIVQGCGGGSPEPDTPPIITLQPQTISTIEGRPAAFHVTAQGGEGLSYQWLRNGQAIANANTASYSLSNATTAESGSSYSVRVSQASGSSVLSQAAKFLVTAPSSISTHLDGKVLPDTSTVFAVDERGAVYTLHETEVAGRTFTVRKYAADGTEVPQDSAAPYPSVSTQEPHCYKKASASRDAAGNIYLAVPYSGMVVINTCELLGGAIYRLSPSDTQFTLIAQSTADNPFTPEAVFFSPSGKMYFVDLYGPKLRELSNTGQVSTLFTLGPLKERNRYFFGEFLEPSFPWIVAAKDGMFYYRGSLNDSPAEGMDIYGIHAYDSQGRNTSVAGKPKDRTDYTPVVPQDGIGRQASFSRITALMRSADGSLIAHDGYAASLLRRIDPASGTTTTFAGNASAGSAVQPGPLPGGLGGVKGAVLGGDGAVYAMEYLGQGYKTYKVAP